jgi:hypothetical protein
VPSASTTARAAAVLVAGLCVAACGGTPVNEVPAASSKAVSDQAASEQAASDQAAPDNLNWQHVQITFYAAYDNDPKGSLHIDNPVIHKQAGGVGSYSDPLTFASATGPGEYPAGTRIYVPLVRKYFIREDSCAVSWTAPSGCGPVTHVDLYVGNPSGSEAVLKCEEALTPDGDAPIALDPPAALPFDPTPIWDESTGTCMTPH